MTPRAAAGPAPRTAWRRLRLERSERADFRLTVTGGAMQYPGGLTLATGKPVGRLELEGKRHQCELCRGRKFTVWYSERHRTISCDKCGLPVLVQPVEAGTA